MGWIIADYRARQRVRRKRCTIDFALSKGRLCYECECDPLNDVHWSILGRVDFHRSSFWWNIWSWILADISIKMSLHTPCEMVNCLATGNGKRLTIAILLCHCAAPGTRNAINCGRLIKGIPEIRKQFEFSNSHALFLLIASLSTWDSESKKTLW